jgi:hypothetical protein
VSKPATATGGFSFAFTPLFFAKGEVQFLQGERNKKSLPQSHRVLNISP